MLERLHEIWMDDDVCCIPRVVRVLRVAVERDGAILRAMCCARAITLLLTNAVTGREYVVGVDQCAAAAADGRREPDYARVLVARVLFAPDNLILRSSSRGIPTRA